MINDKLKQVADLMRECVKAGKMEWKNDHGDWYEWQGNEMPSMKAFEDGLIRPHDPLREFKEAFARGETVEIAGALGWVKLHDNTQWIYSPERYRIAPKRWYRLAKFKNRVDAANSTAQEVQFEYNDDFVCWLTPERVYYW